MTDIVTLGIRIDPSGVVHGVSVGEREFNRLANAADRTTKKVSAVDQGFGMLKRQILGFASVATVLKVFHDWTRAVTESETSNRRLEGTLRATAHAAGLTAGELKDLATEMQATSLVDDEAVKDAMTVLLTFRRIQGDVFREAIALSADLAFTMGGDLQGAAMRLGKALADPVEGMSQLGRSGIKFSAEQEDLVKKLGETNDLLGQQRVIIDGLRNSVGGNAQGGKSGLTGGIHDLKTAYNEFLESLAASPNNLRRFNNIAGLIRALTPETDPRKIAADRMHDLDTQVDRLERERFGRRPGGGWNLRPTSGTMASLDVQIADLRRQREAILAVVRALDAQSDAEKKAARERAEHARREQIASDARAAAEEKRKEVENQIAEITKGLRDEAATFGQSAAQARIYELRMLGASKATLDLAQANADLIDSFNRLADAQFPDFTQQIDDFLSGKGRAGGQPGDHQLTDNQKRLRDINNLNAYGTTDPAVIANIRRANLAQQDENARVTAELDALAEKNAAAAAHFETIWKRAAENSQDALASFFEQIGNKGQKFPRDLLLGVAAAIRQMMAQLAAARILGGAGGGEGWFAKMLKAAASGAAGSALPAAPDMAGDIGDFADLAPRFHRGGRVGGLRPGEIPIIAEQGEGYLSRETMEALRSGGGSGAPVVNVVNHFMVQALDQRGVDAVLERHAGTIAGISLSAMSHLQRRRGN